MTTKKYTSIMIDIVDSRKYDNRDEVQEFMKCIVEFINNIFCKSLKKPLMFSAGDEIQGLFEHPLPAYLCVRFITMICFPVKIRAGIGYGKLAFDDDKWNSTEMDGEAYHNARDAIDSFSSKNSFGIRMNTKSKQDRYINAMLYSSQLLQKQQSVHAQNVKLVAELLFPLYDKEIMETYSFFNEQLNVLLKMKSCISSNSFSIGKIHNTIMKTKITIPDQNIQIFDISIYNLIKTNDMLIENTWKKGMSTMISEILGSTRQNIDKHIRLGKIEENRNIDFSIAGWLIEEFDYE